MTHEKKETGETRVEQQLRDSSASHDVVLAVDPTVKGMGYAVMEGPDDVIDWGTTHTIIGKNSFVRRKVQRLIEYCAPDVLVIEDAAQGRRCARVIKLLETLEKLAQKLGLRVVKIDRGTLHETFANFGAKTKHEISCRLAEYYPQLTRLLPDKRNIWEAEDARYGVFDAAALGFTYYYQARE